MPQLMKSAKILLCVAVMLHAQPSYSMATWLPRERSPIVKIVAGGIIAVLVASAGRTAWNNWHPQIVEKPIVAKPRIVEPESCPRPPNTIDSAEKSATDNPEEATEALLELSCSSHEKKFSDMRSSLLRGVYRDSYAQAQMHLKLLPGQVIGANDVLPAVINSLIRNRADLAAVDHRGYTPIMGAIASGQLAVFQTLLAEDTGAMTRLCKPKYSSESKFEMSLFDFGNDRLARSLHCVKGNKQSAAEELLITRQRAIVDHIIRPVQPSRRPQG